MELKTKKIKIEDSKGKEHEITIQELDWITKNEIADKIVDYRGGGVRKAKMGEARILTLQAGIKEAPFDLGRKNLKKIEPHILEQIYKELDKLSSVKDKKKE